MDLVFKAALGAGVVLLLAVLSKTRNYYIAGLVPLFPTFALIAHYIVGKGRSIADLKTTILFGMWSIIPYFIYLATLYVLVDRMRDLRHVPGLVAQLVGMGVEAGHADHEDLPAHAQLRSGGHEVRVLATRRLAQQLHEVPGPWVQAVERLEQLQVHQRFSSLAACHNAGRNTSATSRSRPLRSKRERRPQSAACAASDGSQACG